MTDLRPIETIYNGFRFRSRLEARWAVFFDQASIHYDYEVEGFELPGGVRYLPDFHLTDINYYVEIKPHHEFTRADIQKAILFSVDADRPLLLIVGAPTSESMYVIDRTTFESWAAEKDYYENDAHLRETFCEQLRTWGEVQFGVVPREAKLRPLYKQNSPYLDAHLSTALLAAKQARFEFGQTPKPPRGA